jgi:hypothetical protein
MHRARRALTWAVLGIGSATFLALLWSLGPARIAARLMGFGWGFALVLPFQIFDHALNAAGWSLSFPPGAARRARFLDLVRVRIAGDGVNYLTPSGNIAGEFVRPGMLRADLPDEVKVASVFLAKAAQAIAQALFVLLGLGWLLHGRLYAFRAGQAGWAVAAMSVIVVGVGICVTALARTPPAWLKRRSPQLVLRTEPLRRLLRDSLGRHPLRLAGSTLLFMCGYAWGAAEIWLIARLLGLTLSAGTALSVEFLSNLVDSLAFMVPAKIGTQEAGKTAIFKGLGLAPDLGFTVGLIRHLRELCWAGFGLSLYAAHQRRQSAKT